MFTSQGQVKVWLFTALEDKQHTYGGYIEASPCSLYDDCCSRLVQFHSPNTLTTPLLHGGENELTVLTTKLCN